ncbi:MAG TPA: hypothetical protein PLA46_12325, partial [Phycicoccus sp.]|nr:hypothetical protein [Phycicoccus sp.]
MIATGAGAGLAVAGAGLAYAGGLASADRPVGGAGPAAGAAGGGEDLSAAVSFRGVRQAGIITPAQDRMHFVALDVVPGTTRAELAGMFKA